MLPKKCCASFTVDGVCGVVCMCADGLCVCWCDDRHRPVPPPPTVPASKMINITSRTKQAQIAAQAASAAAQVETTLHKTHEIIDKYTARAYHIIKVVIASYSQYTLFIL